MKTRLPKDWREIEFLESLESDVSKNKFKIKQSDYLENGKYPIIDQSVDFISGYTNDKSKVYSDKLPVVIFGDHTRIFKFVDFPFALGADGTKILVPRSDINPKYYYYFLRNLKIPSAGYSRHYKFLKERKIIILSFPTQQKIVSILEKAEKLKKMRDEADKLIKDYLKAVFLEMFGDPVTNSKKWEVKKMKDISKKIVNGTTPKGGKKVYVEKGIVFFRSQNVWKNRLSLGDVAHIDDDTHSKMIKSSLKNKDILITKTGRINTENSSLGRAAMFLGEDNSANINGHVYLIRLQENIIPEFVLFIITTNEYREYIRSVCVGGIDKRQINKEHLQNFPIIFPPVELQNKFVSIVKEVELLMEYQKQSREHIENLFNNLMQKAFKGELVA